MGKTFKYVINTLVILITVAMTCCTGFLIYYKTAGKDKIPSAITSTYATTITDPQSGEELPVLEANYYENKNGLGYEVIELRINSYSGISKQAVYSRGFQLVKNKAGEIIPFVDVDGKSSNIYYYDSYGGVSFETGHILGWGDPMLVDIDETTYAIKLDGTYTLHHKDVNKGKIWRTIGFLGLNLIFEGTNFYNEYDTTHNYTFEDLLNKMKSIIKSCSNGTGSGYISLIDLGDFLHVYEVDENGTIAAEPVGQNTLINSYFTMSASYDTRGMVWTRQSLFGSVAGDSQFNISGLLFEADYWKAESRIMLSEQDFDMRYSAVDDGYYFYLSTAKMNELKNFDSSEIYIDFNVSNLDVKCLGFDHYALYGIEVKRLSIISDTQRDFALLVGSLKGTGLTSVSTTNINLINTNSGVVLWNGIIM